MVKNIILAVSNVYALKGIKDFFETLTSLEIESSSRFNWLWIGNMYDSWYCSIIP